ncbi:DEAD/DEAH box helicase [Candidatus Kaiserbacteria bacterium]|nr:DEAD/DEAH box helicase [Candidatus Kaiserbacteria bacterium]
MNQSEFTFDGLGIAPAIRDVLARLKYTTPTPIQHQSIPMAIEGKDVIGVAQTGTGKTLAFGIPMIQRLAQAEGRGLVLVPTRELALQVDETLRKIGGPLGIKTAVLIGGAPMNPQIRSLHANPNIVIATPGRLIDHLEQGTIRLTHVAVLVLDEADRMLDMGFLPQMKKILVTIPKERQTMLFSATLSREIMAIAGTHMTVPTSIEIAPQGTTAELVTQEIFIVSKASKAALLEKVLTEYRGPTLVFTRMKHSAKRVAARLRDVGHTAAEIHSNRSLGQRKEALEGFKRGKYRVLVATDIAARGIDVSNIELVVNYDLPMQTADYVHRIGRTGRAGAKGHAISFAMPTERREIRDIENLTKKALPVRPTPTDLPYIAPAPYEEDRPRSFRGGSRGPSRGRPSFTGSRGPARGRSGGSSFRRR